MKGMIVIWSGPIVSIPAGWVLCDGSNGTPDLRDKFVIGAGGAYAVGASGGAATHTHPFTSNVHNHTLGAGIVLMAGAGLSNVTNNKAVTGTTNASSSLPPYYALSYIMKS